MAKGERAARQGRQWHRGCKLPIRAGDGKWCTRNGPVQEAPACQAGLSGCHMYRCLRTSGTCAGALGPPGHELPMGEGDGGW